MCVYASIAHAARSLILPLLRHLNFRSNQKLGIISFFLALILSALCLKNGQAGFGFPVGKKVSLLHIVQTGSGAHPATRGVKVTTDLHLVTRSRVVAPYRRSPIRPHGVVLN
jgi:hypothetical protein